MYASELNNIEGESERDGVVDWNVGQVCKWAKAEKLDSVVAFIQAEDIDGKALLMLTDLDIQNKLTIGIRKNLMLAIRALHRSSNYATLDFLGLLDAPSMHNNHHQSSTGNILDLAGSFAGNAGAYGSVPGSHGSGGDIGRISPASSTVGGRAVVISNKPEVFKTFVSVGEYVDGEGFKDSHCGCSS